MAKPLLFGDLNEIRITRSCDINGEHYLPFDKLTVGEAHARQLIEEGVAEVVSMEWSEGLKLHGQSIRTIRK
jgi:hypothetical protein